MDPGQRIEELRPVILRAGKHAEKMRQNRNIEINIKDDETPVTNVDFWCNEFLKEEIRKLYPNDLYIGEEDNIQTFNTGFPTIWFVDPIDGTRSFIDGTAPYYILIGLVIDGEPVLGMIYEPEKRRLIYGYKGAGVFIQWGDNPPVKPEIDLRWNTHLPIVIKGADRTFYHKFEKETGIRRIGHIADMHNALAPVEKRTQGLVSRRKTWLWDYVGPAAVMGAAGYEWGCYKDGKPVDLSFGETLVDSNYVLPHDTPQNVRKLLLP